MRTSSLLPQESGNKANFATYYTSLECVLHVAATYDAPPNPLPNPELKPSKPPPKPPPKPLPKPLSPNIPPLEPIEEEQVEPMTQ